MWLTVRFADQAAAVSEGSRLENLETAMLLVMLIVIGSIAIGPISIVALADVNLRPWEKHAALFGVGASAGGIIGMIIVGQLGARLTRMTESFYGALGLKPILKALGIQTEDWVFLSIVLGTFMAGGFVSWCIFNRSRFRR